MLALTQCNIFFQWFCIPGGLYSLTRDVNQLKVGDNIIIRPTKPQFHENGKPWLAKVLKVSQRGVVTFEFFSGSYDTVWQLGVYANGKGKLPIQRIECILTWNELKPMPNGLVKELCCLLDE